MAYRQVGVKADIITAALGPMFTTMMTITVAVTALLGGWLALRDWRPAQGVALGLAGFLTGSEAGRAPGSDPYGATIARWCAEYGVNPGLAQLHHQRLQHAGGPQVSQVAVGRFTALRQVRQKTFQ